MAMTIGGKTPQSIEIGGKAVQSLAIGGEVVWSAGPAVDYFRLTPTSGNTRIVLHKQGSPADITLEYSTNDGLTWTTWSSANGDLIVTTNPSSPLLLRGDNNTLGSSSSNYYYFYANDPFEISGNIMTLLDSTGTLLSLSGKSYCFYKLFGGQSPNYVKIGDLKMPATTLAPYCYTYMFDSGTRITTCPSDLLPATTLAQGCYAFMFIGCLHLAKSPILPATALAVGSYSNMFNGCRELSEVTTYANNISANYCLQDWLKNVSGTGDFYLLGSANFPGGASGIPIGWTVHTSL